jgi:hypothetical protein
VNKADVGMSSSAQLHLTFHYAKGFWLHLVKLNVLLYYGPMYLPVFSRVAAHPNIVKCFKTCFLAIVRCKLRNDGIPSQLLTFRNEP